MKRKNKKLKKPNQKVTRRRRFRDYTSEAMKNAIKNVHQGMSIRQAASSNDVPYSTLNNKVNQKFGEKMGPDTILSTEFEDALYQWCKLMYELRFPITIDLIFDSVQKYLVTNKIETNFKNSRPGYTWFNLFMNRYPDLRMRTPQSLIKSRDISEKELRTWFEEVEKYLIEKNLLEIFNDRSRIFNTDESAFFLAPKGNRVIAKKGEKTVYSSVQNSDKENLTVLITASANGDLAPPMLVYDYERIPSEIAKNMPDNWAIGKSSSGWMCSDTFYEYITNVFDRWLDEKGIQRPVILFLDGHASHMTWHLSEFCSQKQIELICLYPNSTHITQPLDVSVFHPMKSYWKKEVMRWRLIDGNNGKLQKKDLPKILKPVLDSIHPDSFKNGFEACGLCPFNFKNVKFYKSKDDIAINKKRDISNSLIDQITLKRITKNIPPETLEKFHRLYTLTNGTELDFNVEYVSLYNIWAELMDNVHPDYKNPNSTSTITSTTMLEEINESMMENDELSLPALSDSTINITETVTVNEKLTSDQLRLIHLNKITDDTEVLLPNISISTIDITKASMNAAVTVTTPDNRTISISTPNVSTLINANVITPNKEPNESTDNTEVLLPNISISTIDITKASLNATVTVTTPDNRTISISTPNVSTLISANVITPSKRPNETTDNTEVLLPTISISTPNNTDTLSLFNVTLTTPEQLNQNSRNMITSTPISSRKRCVNTDINDIKNNIPSPFRRALFFPTEVQEKQLKYRRKEKLPAAMCSNAWKEYHIKKKRDKEMKEQERILKKEAKILQKKEKEAALAKKRANRKKVK